MPPTKNRPHTAAVILIGSEKGGTGKTTLAANIAAMCAQAGKETLLIDTDKQQSATDWAAIRATNRSDKNLKVDLACVTKTGRVGYDIEQLRPKFDVIVVDAGGRDSVELRQAMAVCDQMIIPMRPAQFDTWSMDKMAQLLRDIAEKIGQPVPARIVLNAVSTNPSVRESEETRAFLATEYKDEFSVCAAQVGDRIAIRRAVRDGMCVMELPKSLADANAAEEMQRLYKEIFNEPWNRAQAPAA